MDVILNPYQSNERSFYVDQIVFVKIGGTFDGLFNSHFTADIFSNFRNYGDPWCPDQVFPSALNP